MQLVSVPLRHTLLLLSCAAGIVACSGRSSGPPLGAAADAGVVTRDAARPPGDSAVAATCVALSETFTDPTPGAPPQSRTRWTYDGDGRPLSKEDDFDADGTYEMIVRYEHDARGRIAREEVRTPVDAPLPLVTRYTYEGDTSMTKEHYRQDGTLDTRELHRYEHDAAGRLTLEEIDSSADGTLDYRLEHRYDASGLNVASDVTTLSDATVQHITRTFDAERRITGLQIRWEAAGLPERVDVTTMTWGPDTLVVDQDIYDDGAIDAHVVVTWEGCTRPPFYDLI